MEKSKRKHDDNALYVFKPKVILGTIEMVAVWVIITGGIFSLFVGFSESLTFMLLALVMFSIIGILSVPIHARRSIRIYEDGIEYRDGKYHIFSDWDNLIDFECRRYRRNEIEGLVTKEPVQHSKIPTFLEKWLWNRWDNQFINISAVMNIPTRHAELFNRRVDLEKLQETEFGQLLYGYAPHLFEKGNVS